MNYDELTRQIGEYANRTDEHFVSNIPNFIRQGVERIYSEAKNIGFEKRIGLNAMARKPIIPKPIDWRETISLDITDPDTNKSKLLWLRSYEFCKEFTPIDTDFAEPEFYADTFASHVTDTSYGGIFLAPTPNKAYKCNLIYLTIPMFDKRNQTNFLTRRYSRLLFYACFLEAMPFLRDDERLPQMEQLYASALADANQDTTDRHTDRTSNRDKE